MPKYDITREDIPESSLGLYEIVGADLFMQIVNVYGGTPIYIPKRERIELRAKIEAINQDRAAGDIIKVIARRHGLSARRVQEILKEAIV